MSRLLEVDSLRVSYGRGVAIAGLSLCCDAGEIVSLVGPNGAGKTSSLMGIAGVLRRGVSGRVRLRGVEICGRGADEIARYGLSLVPETRRAFVDLTVHDNLTIGALRLPHADRKRRVEALYERIPVLGRLRDRLAGRLSGGEQQLLVLARAVVGRPALLLLDEPSLGLSPVAVGQIYGLIRDLVQQDGVAALLVEQNALTALELASHCVVLRSGRVEMQGSAARLRHDQAFLDAYFGVADSREEAVA